MRRVAIVTGGASGIGQALCRSAVKRGAHVVVADLDEVAAKRVVEELGRLRGGRRRRWREGTR